MEAASCVVSGQMEVTISDCLDKDIKAGDNGICGRKINGPEAPRVMVKAAADTPRNIHKNN